jgi:hypothetical protein
MLHTIHKLVWNWPAEQPYNKVYYWYILVFTTCINLLTSHACAQLMCHIFKSTVHSVFSRYWTGWWSSGDDANRHSFASAWALRDRNNSGLVGINPGCELLPTCCTEPFCLLRTMYPLMNYYIHILDWMIQSQPSIALSWYLYRLPPELLLCEPSLCHYGGESRPNEELT